MRLSPSSTAFFVCCFLFLAIAIVFGQTVCHDFVLYDDNVYVYENPQVTGGLTSASIAWAMTTSRAANWHPLTWFSHILDCQFFGLWAGGHHLTSILLHAATAILLFLVLWRMTGDLWPSAFVATVFAIHPLRVESVAWVAERKDVLSSVFFMLTLGAYVSYVRRPFSLSRYLMVVAAFALGLMAKPTLVTVPCVLLLLDYWPLDRLKTQPTPPKESKRPAKAKTKARNAVASMAPAPPRFSIPRRVILEKIPLLFLTAYSCLVTTVVQGEALREFDEMTVGARLADSVISYAAYLGQFVWPTNLAVLYPHPRGDLPIWNLIAASLVLATISAAAIACWRRIPAVPVGWLWYLGMMVPMIGIIQVGEQAMADRYTYLPQIGLCIAIAWGVPALLLALRVRLTQEDASQSVKSTRTLCFAASAVIVPALMACAWHQTTFWQDTQTLWHRALDCTAGSCTAHLNPAIDYQRLGDLDAAIEHYQDAIVFDPKSSNAHNNLGTALLRKDRIDEAMKAFRKAAELSPDSAEAHSNIAAILECQGVYDESLWHFQHALALAEQQNKEPLADSLRKRLQRYEVKAPPDQPK